MRTQKETDLEDEIECLKADLADALTWRRFIIDELEKENTSLKEVVEAAKTFLNEGGRALPLYDAIAKLEEST